MIIIDELLELYKPVVFAHKYHADMSKMGAGCTECHHYSPAGNYPACKECHDAAVTSLDRPNINQPGLKGAYHQQCLDCHIAWSNTTGCNFCHLSIEQALAGKDIRGEGDSYHLSQPRIKSEARYVYETEYEDGPMVTFYHDNHVDMFGLECADCHQGDACGSCHRVGAIARVKGDLHEDCSTCHDENDCTICHRSSVAPAFSHAAKSGWELGAQHENLACSACHNTARASGMLSSSCGECHQSWEVGNFDHAVTGLALNIEHAELDCESCHGDPLFANTPICSSCHDGDVAYPEDVPGARSNDN
ncbi:MAG: hypothetical protein JSU61_12985 [Fidelibacterota bacterium]|nr:MAG: hypothetical protein JSU61_12985 [Candidatus Neomarinimicrobiota bacterium]